MARYRDPLTKDLFAWEPPQVAVRYGEEVAGRGALDNKIARLIGHALREAREDGVSRPEVARRMATYLGRPLEGLDDRRAIETIMRAAEFCAFQHLGVSKSLWRDAGAVLGVWGAVLAVMVVASKDPEHFSRTPAHYFAGMIERAKAGTLRLDRSIWGLRSRGNHPAGAA